MIRCFSFILIASISTLVHGAPTKISARAVAEKNHQRRSVKNYQADVRLETLTQSGKKKLKAFSMYRKAQPGGKFFNSLTRFYEPASIKDQAVLFIENGDSGNDIFLYLPRFKRTRRIENNNQSGSFMGTVFNYSDLITPHLDDYDYKLVKQEACPYPKGNKVRCFILRSTPKSRAVANKRGYHFLLSWIREDNFMSSQVKGYDEKKKLIKIINFSDFQKMQDNPLNYLAKTIRAEEPESKRYSIFSMSKVEPDKQIPNSIFQKDRLQYSQ